MRDALERGTHTLVELPVSAPGHGRIVSAVHFGNVVALNVGDFIHREIASKWDPRRKSQGAKC